MTNPLDCRIALAGALMLGAVVVAGPAMAQEATEVSQTQEAQVAGDAREPTVLVCKVFAVTGTRIAREYCLTEDDWDQIREDSRETLERLMRIGAEV